MRFAYTWAAAQVYSAWGASITRESSLLFRYPIAAFKKVFGEEPNKDLLVSFLKPLLSAKLMLWYGLLIVVAVLRKFFKYCSIHDVSFNTLFGIINMQ